MSRVALRGLEEHGEETPWCVQCDQFLKWPYHDECLGCLTVGGRPAETVSFRTVHWDVAVLHAVIRRKIAVWEQRHPGWELVPDMQRYWEDSTHPSKYVDRETGIGRKLAWTRFRVARKHPRGGGRGPGLERYLAIVDAQAVHALVWARIVSAGGMMAEPEEREEQAPSPPLEPEDVPEPVVPEPAAPVEEEEAPA